MSTTSIKVANSNQPSLTQKLEVGRHLKMTSIQGNKKVVDIDTNRKQYNEIYQANQGKLKSVNALSLRDRRYDSIMILSSLDGNTSNISYKDLKIAKDRLKGHCGVKNTIWNGNTGELTIVYEDNTEMKIDVETSYEKDKRIKAENDAKAKAEAKKKASEQPKEPSLGDKIIDFLEDLFNGNL